MKIVVTGKDIKIGEQLREKVEKKLSKFSRYFDDNAITTVKLRPDANNTVCAEITMKIQKHYYRAESVAQEVMTALDDAIDIMEGQIRKHKSRLEKNIRDFAYMNEYLKAADDFVDDEIEDQEDYVPDIIRRKTFLLSAMSPEEAVLQMEMLGHSFLLYLSPDTGKVCLVYKRKDGNYGLLEPEY